MRGNKKLIAGLVAAIVIVSALWVVSLVFGGKKVFAPGHTPSPSVQAVKTPEVTPSAVPKQATNPPKQQTQTNQTQSNQAQKKPTFMYFISASDARFAETNAILADLKKKYGDRVNFDIRNIDENPDDKTRYSITVTPTLYLMASDGEFKDIKLGFADEAALEQSIKKVID
ncbi:MAG: hypothetical protein N2171_07220 [Clostridia bacterium]|nr:hypothetical protein [Clostridia bacterium]